MFTLDRNKKIIVYGAGTKGKQVCNTMLRAGFNLLYILDRNSAIWGQKCTSDNGREIFVWGPDRIREENDREKIVIICTLENGLHHEAAAETLYNEGARNIIFLPVLHIGENEGKNRMISAYNQILQDDINPDVLYNLPEYDEISFEAGNPCLYGQHWEQVGESVVTYLPLELLYSESVKHKEIDTRRKCMLTRFDETNLTARHDYYQMWDFLRYGKNDCDFYIRIQRAGDPGRAIDPEDKRRILKDRRSLMAIYDKEYDGGAKQDSSFTRRQSVILSQKVQL